MDIMTLIFGSASIFGALVSIQQACAAKTAAQKAEDARAQIVENRKTSELAELKTLCGIAQKSIEKYGEAANPLTLKGASLDRDCDDVQKFLLKLKEYRTIFGSKSHNPADEFGDKVRPLLKKLAQSSPSPVEMCKFGSQILGKLSDMSAKIKTPLDRKKETVN